MRFVKSLFFVLLLLPSLAQAFTLGSSGASPKFKGWDTRTLTFNVNYTNCLISNDELNTLINDAFAVWNTVSSSNLKLVLGSESTTTPDEALANSTPGNPVIVCDDQFATTLSFSSGEENAIPAVGGMSYDSHVVLGYVILNAMPAADANISKMSKAEMTYILAHEIGHVLGLGHSSDKKALMYYAVQDRAELRLSPDDIAGFTYLNPRDEISGDGVYGCGTAGAAGTTGSSHRSSSGFLQMSFLCAMAFLFHRRKKLTWH